MVRFPSIAPVLSLLVGLFLAQPASPQSQAPEPEQQPMIVLKTDSRAVLVDVVVTDRDGKAVRGLHPESFQIAEDGAAQKIVSFEEHSAAPVDASGKIPVFPTLTPDLYTNIPRVKLTDAVTVLLLDTLNTEMKDQSYVHKQILDYLGNPQPGRRMAIFALGAKLHFVQGFTTEPAVLATALKDLKRGSGQEDSDIVVSKTQQAVNQTVNDQLIELGNESRSAYDDQQMAIAMKQFMGEQTASMTDLRVMLTLEAFQQLAHYLSGIPGRKNVVWFSGSFPLTLFANQDLSDPSAAQREFSEKVKKTDRLLAAANVAVYPIAAEGLATDSLYDVNQKMVIPGQYQQNEQIRQMQTDSQERVQNQSTMDEIAQATGGQAFYNTNGLAKALAQVADAGANFYTLSYVPTNPQSDGQFRKIQVKLAGGSYKLSYRRGYFASDPASDAAEEARSHRDPLSAFMGPGLPDTTDISLAVRVLPETAQLASNPAAASTPQTGTTPGSPTQSSQPARAGDNAKLSGPLKRYSIDYLLTAHGVQLQSSEDGSRHGKLEVAMIAYSQEGRALNWIERGYQLNLSPEQYSDIEKRGLKFHMDIDVPKDGATLRAGVYDLASHRAAALEIPLRTVVAPDPMTASTAK